MSVWVLIWTWQDIKWPPYSQLISHVLIQPCYKISLRYSNPTRPFYKGMGSIRTPCHGPPQKPPGRLFLCDWPLSHQFCLPSLDVYFHFCHLFLLIGNRYFYIFQREKKKRGRQTDRQKEKIPMDVFPSFFQLLSPNCCSTICFSFRYHE